MTPARRSRAGIAVGGTLSRRHRRGVRVAVIDSGVHPGHPHVGVVDAGVSFDADGARGVDTVDRLGHGTAVAAAIREKAPDAAIMPVKVFDRELRATADALVAAIDWAVDARVHLINLSLGTANPAHQARLGEALVRAARGRRLPGGGGRTGRHAVAARQPAAGRRRDARLGLPA